MEGELVIPIASDYIISESCTCILLLSMILISSTGGDGRASVEMERM